MVNAHKKFPVDIKNNTYYAADGSDLREATEEEIEKYRLAALHKRRKPEVGASSEMSVSATAVSKEEKDKADQTPKRDATRHREESPRNHSRHDVSKSKDDGKGGRTASRDSRKDRDGLRDTRVRSDGEKRRSEKTLDTRRPDRDEKAGGDNEEVDEDERDRHKMAEIRHRIEERKAAKASTIGRADATGVEMSASITTVSLDKKPRKASVESKKADEKPAKPARVSKKTSTHQKDSTTADVAQRENAMKWASTTASATEIVAPNAIKQGSTLLKKKCADKRQQKRGETAESFAIQEFIAAQYPHLEKVVSTTVRLGLALVSGALGRKIDDPKMFETVVNLTDCDVVLQSTRKKSKVPVSAAPPNSMESEMDVDESVQLSQSATDIGVHIGLPEGETELDYQRPTGEVDTVRPMDAEDTDVPRCSEAASTPVLIPLAGTHSALCAGPTNAEAQKTPVEPIMSSMAECTRGTNPTESQRMLREIDNAKLLHEELLKRDPTLATAASFLDLVCGGGEK